MPAWNVFDQKRLAMFNASSSALGATPGLRMLAASAAFNPEASSYSTYADITTWVFDGTVSGWTTFGEAIANETVTLVTATGTVVSDFDDVVFSSAAAGPTNIRYFVVTTSAATTAASQLVGWTSTGSDKSIQSGDITVQIDADGFIISTR